MTVLSTGQVKQLLDQLVKEKVKLKLEINLAGDGKDELKVFVTRYELRVEDTLLFRN